MSQNLSDSLDRTQVDSHTMQTIQDALDTLSSTAGRVLLKLRGYECGSRGECRAKVATLAHQLNRSPRTIQRALADLRRVGFWTRTRRRMRFSSRELTDLGRLACRVMVGEPIDVVYRDPELETSPHLTPHNGKADHTPKRKTKKELAAIRPTEWSPNARHGRWALSPTTWRELASWMEHTGANSSWARCKIAHRGFAGLRDAIERAKGFDVWKVLHPHWGAEDLLRVCVGEAIRSGKTFGTVESAMKLVGKIAASCIDEKRFPRACAQAGALL